MEIVEEGIEKSQAGLKIVVCGQDANSMQSSAELSHCVSNCDQEEADVKMEDCQPDETKESSIDNSELPVEDSSGEHPEGGSATTDLIEASSGCSLRAEPDNLSTVPFQTSPVHSPTLSVSPRLDGFSRKSLRTAAKSFSCQHSNVNPEVLNLSFALTVAKTPDTETSTNSVMPTESIAASLQWGLQVIENHQQSSPLRFSFAFSCKALDCKPFQLMEKKIDAATQTVPETRGTFGDSSEFVCSLCKRRPALNSEEAESMDLPLVPVDASHLSDAPMVQIPK